MAVTPEGKVKQKVTAILKKYEPRVYYNMPVPMGYGESMLDYVGCVNQMFFMVETKRPGKVPTDRQKQCASRVKRAGGTVFTITAPDDPVLEEFEQWLVYHLHRTPIL
jgi:hypothetical protein